MRILEYAKQLKDSISESLTGRTKNKIIKACNQVIAEQDFNRSYTGPVQVWTGLSRFDREPIQIVLECYAKDSTNKKTGPMIQVSILPLKNPQKVFKSKEESVCGDCKYLGGGCYVAWNRLKKPSETKYIGSVSLGKSLLMGARVRIGKAGDPCAVDIDVWKDLLSTCDSFTGYTHAWKNVHNDYSDLFMASCDSLKEVNEALKIGWAPFHVYDIKDNKEELTHPNSLQCLYREIDASKLQFQSIQCFDCMKCHGKTAKRLNRPITVQLHGATNTVYAARKARGLK